MPLTQSQKSIWERARVLGSGSQAVGLDDDICRYLIARIAADLDVLEAFPDFSHAVPEFYSERDLTNLVLKGPPAIQAYEKLIGLSPDADTYFACLASLHKARLKYQTILETQPIPTMEQVGPRGLLQYGTMSPASLGALLFWRKWFFDIDNRAGQETGYLFEPVIAYAVGGTHVPAGRSPVKRSQDGSKGRQIDCLTGDRAYEIKIRVTIAASGQGRWGEELEFPVDCRNSGYQPVLVVLDGTDNPKLAELTRTFLDNGGQVYIGDDAWDHLDALAGDTLAIFVERYVRQPLDQVFKEMPSPLPEMSISQVGAFIEIKIGSETLRISRRSFGADEDERDNTPDDLVTSLPGG